MKKPTGFKLEVLAVVRLQEMAEQCRMTQTAILEELINACFDEACEGYPVRDGFNNKGFDRFVASMNYRLNVISK